MIVDTELENMHISDLFKNNVSRTVINKIKNQINSQRKSEGGCAMFTVIVPLPDESGTIECIAPTHDDRDAMCVLLEEGNISRLVNYLKTEAWSTTLIKHKSEPGDLLRKKDRNGNTNLFTRVSRRSLKRYKSGNEAPSEFDKDEDPAVEHAAEGCISEDCNATPDANIGHSSSDNSSAHAANETSDAEEPCC